ncbi:hypothetical protein [Acutalibacter sp. 1XD8-33]|uniref:hypothetical protein n=1 Tax=Acutalibacter sp. 1XD8-33 TaxID=2320081 RepID=UPI0011C44F53|nr:hypothetical protein [Acutalibacter sp. 1XD8-33]
MAMAEKTAPVKRCPVCGALMVRKRYNGRLEDMGAFLRRVYCSRKCMAKGYTKADATLAALRKRSSKMRGKSC